MVRPHFEWKYDTILRSTKLRNIIYNEQTQQEKSQRLGADASLIQRNREIAYFPTVEDRALPTAVSMLRNLAID